MADLILPDPYRSKPYAVSTLHRMACAHCRTRPASARWSVAICANNRRRVEVAICEECDLEFNRHTLAFINHPDADELMAQYGADA